MCQTAAMGLLADLHILYPTKQNTHQSLPPDIFSGLKIPAKYICVRSSAPDHAGGAYSALPVPLAALGGGEEKGKGWEERAGQGRGGEGAGKGRRKGMGEEEKRGGEGMPPLFLGQVYASVL